MAFRGQIIRNPHTGFSIRFVKTKQDTDGHLLEMEALYPPHSPKPPTHYHPFQEEVFTILSGEMMVRMQNKIKKYKAGQSFVVPPNCPHSMWNNAGTPAKLNWKVMPAMHSEDFMETIFELANGKPALQNNEPGFWHKILLAHRFENVYRVHKPPFAVMRLIVRMLFPLAKVFASIPVC